MPGKKRYTTYNEANGPRKDFRDKLFSSGPFSGLDAEAIANQVIENGNKLLRASGNRGSKRGDADMFPQGVDMSYEGKNLPFGPANGEVNVDSAGDPMNAFVPDVSSPGPGKTDGVDKDLALNPKLKPEEYKPGYVPSSNTRQPKGSSVYEKNVLGKENNFNTTDVEQYPE